MKHETIESFNFKMKSLSRISTLRFCAFKQRLAQRKQDNCLVTSKLNATHFKGSFQKIILKKYINHDPSSFDIADFKTLRSARIYDCKSKKNP